MTNNILQYKLLRYFHQRTKLQGFTIIELLIVIIILSILTATTLPTLIGQVGKARETEIKNAVGTVNRTQQSFFFENQRFGTETQLDLNITTNDYLNALNIATAANLATVAPSNVDDQADNTRAYSGAVEFDPATGGYATVVCRTTDAAVNLQPPDNSITGQEEVRDPCPNPSGTGVVVK